MIVDETHSVASESAQTIAKASINAYYRAGFSASPWRADNTDLLIHAVTGPRLINITCSDLIDKGHLVPPTFYFYNNKCTFTGEQPTAFQKIYEQFIVNNEARNQLICTLAQKLYNNYKPTIILVQQIQHGKNLLKMLQRKGVKVQFIWGDSDLEKREKVLKSFKANKLRMIISSSILSEGVNITNLEAIINAGGGQSSVQYYQKVGRALRTHPGKEKAIVIDFLDRGVRYLNKHAQHRLKILQTEPRFEIKMQQ